MEQIRIKGNLTPNFVSDKMSPFLDALQSIQHTIDEIKQAPPTPVKINEIRWEGADALESDVLFENSKATVFLDGVRKTLSDLRETLDYLSEEPRNQNFHLAGARLAQAAYQEVCHRIEFNALQFGHTHTPRINVWQWEPSDYLYPRFRQVEKKDFIDAYKIRERLSNLELSENATLDIKILKQTMPDKGEGK